MSSTYQVFTTGTEYTSSHRVYIGKLRSQIIKEDPTKIQVEHNGQVISPFHDIPLYADSEKKIVNMIVEIPRWSNAKYEVDLYYIYIFIYSVANRNFVCVLVDCYR